jgi:hypothetical protein
MREALISVAVGTAVLLSGGFTPARCAELGPSPAVIAPPITAGCRSVWICGAHDCGWRPICRPAAAERYYGYPLYGAYGPYGGTAYWGGYTASGWGYR